MTRRHRIDQALAPGAPAGEAGHRCGGGGLVDEDEALRIHVTLPRPPATAVPGHVGPILLGRSQALFLCDRSSRCSMSAMVDSAFTTIPRAPRAALISRSVGSQPGATRWPAGRPHAPPGEDAERRQSWLVPCCPSGVPAASA